MFASGFWWALGFVAALFAVYIVLIVLAVSAKLLRRKLDPLGSALDDYIRALTRK